MTESAQRRGWIARMRLRATLTVAVMLGLGILTSSAKAQSLIDLYKFTGGRDGGFPFARLTLRKGGGLYGTTQVFGKGNGTIFRVQHSEHGWAATVLYSFTGDRDGSGTSASLTFDKGSNIYGTTEQGGNGKCQQGGYGCGVVFELKRSRNGWKKIELHSFAGGSADGAAPLAGVIFDEGGSLYGTTQTGGDQSCYEGCGTAFQMMYANDRWKERVIYRFAGGNDGSYPSGGLVADKDGNLYGMTDNGGGTGCYSGYGCGTVFQLKHSSSGWKENVLHKFTGGSDGASPQYSSLISDADGNLYGTTTRGGTYGGGVAFRLSPSNGGWKETVLYAFDSNGSSPSGTLVFDENHDLYGTTAAGGDHGYGTVYRLRYSNGAWTQTVLHSFAGTDGIYPEGGLVIGTEGRLYGTAEFGGDGNCSGGCGVVFRIKR